MAAWQKAYLACLLALAAKGYVANRFDVGDGVSGGLRKGPPEAGPPRLRQGLRAQEHSLRGRKHMTTSAQGYVDTWNTWHAWVAWTRI